MASIILKPYERRRAPGPIARFLLGSLLVFVAIIYGLMAVILPPELISYPATPIFIMIGIILWLLPDIGGVEYDRLQGVMITYVAISIAWPSYVAFNLPGLPWISLTRGALGIVLVIFLYNYSTSSDMRGKVRDAVSETPVAIRAFWAFWAISTFSIVFTTDLSPTITKYVNNQIYWTMSMLVTALLATRPGFVMKLAKTLVISTAIVLCYSLYEYNIQRVPWIDYLPSFLKIDPTLLEVLMRTQARAGTDIYRVRGPYAASLYFSEFLTMAFPFLLHFTFTARRPLHVILLAAGVVACISVMVFTNARSAMVGAIAGSIIYLFYASLRQRTLFPNSLIGSSVVFAYPTIVAITAILVQFWPRLHVMVLGGGQHQPSSDARDAQWAMAWPKLATHPFGYGVNRGGASLGYTNLAGEGTVDSYYISVMMDSGYLALPLFLMTFLIPAAFAFWYYRNAVSLEQQLLAPLSIAIINFCIVKSVLSSEASMPLAFVFVGCIMGLIWQRKRLISPTPAMAAVAAAAPARRPGQPVLAPPPLRPALVGPNPR